MKKLLGGAAVVAVGALGLVTLTGFHGGCGGHRHGRDPAQVAAFLTDRVDGVLDDVDATPDQRSRIHALKDRVLAAGQEAHAGHREVHDTFVSEWKSEAPDRARLHALVDERVEALRKVGHEAVDAGVDAHGVLTPAQRERVTRKIERLHR